MNPFKLLKKSNAKISSEAGYTLLEVMVVVVIIGLLATIVAINVLPSQDRAMIEKARADVNVLTQAVEMYRLAVRQYPPIEGGLDNLINPPSGQQPFIRTLPEDPWGNAYQYVYPGEHGPFDIFSMGADGRPGGDGDNADIGNW